MKVLSIAFMTFKAAVRSRTAVSLAVVILLAVLGIPSVLDSDMNPAQAVNVALFYTLSAVEIILCIAAIWTGAASFSQDIKIKTFHLLRVKPVAAYQIWIGKWLGLVSLFALLLFFGFAGMFVRIHMLGNGDLPANASIASRLISPDLPDTDAQIETLVSLARDENGEPLKGKERAAYRREVAMQIPYLSDSISSGQEWNWTFHLPRKVEAGRPLGFRFKFDSDAMSREGIKARCTVTSPDTKKSVVFDLPDFTSREIEMPLESVNFEGAEVLELRISHIGEKGVGSIILQPRKGLFLMQPASSLTENMARAFIVSLSVIALVAALGLTLGAFFTLPVAVFCSVALIATVLISNCTIMGESGTHEHYSEDETVLERAELMLGDWIVDTVVFISSPVYRSEPMSKLSSFEYIENPDVARAFCGNFIVIPAVFALISSWVLRRKELGE